MANNTKVFFGDKLPNIFIDPSALPGGAGRVAAPSQSGRSA
tara:strand:+ start:708 stop:830 length:123 start_codon:yes stop_codon:yes gene_type:complete